MMTRTNTVASLIVVGALTAFLYAQQAQCDATGACANQPCQILPGGPIMNCNCCYAGNGLFQCCDNIPCSECITEDGPA